MEKIFEYKIEVDTSQLDEAESKVNNLEESTSSTSKSMAKNFDTVGDAAKNIPVNQWKSWVHNW